MASPLRLTVALASGWDRSPADGAWAGVQVEFEASEQAMSRFRDTSEVTALNRIAGSGGATAVSRRLAIALATSDRARRLTDGRFDPRILDALERLGDRGVPLPRPGSVRAAGSRVFARCPDGRVVIDRPVDLGGIGKGLALRWAARRLRAALPATPFLLEAGGDVVAAGDGPAGDAPWRIGVEDPRGGAPPLAVAAVPNGAIVTSSIRVRQWKDDGRTVHHLIEPATGEPGGDGLAAVTVAGPDPAWAEVRSKTLFLLGRRAIADRARALGLAAWWVGDDGTLEMTPAARARTLWARGDFEQQD
jgi:thiamine biosynthesis lipoprotein